MTQDASDSPLQDNDLYDFAALQSLLDTLGADTFSSLITDCLEKVDEIVALAQQPEHQSDAEFIYERMHELKGMTYNFGLKGLGDIAGDGEAAAKEGNLETALIAVEKLGPAKDTTRSEIEAWVASKV